MGRTRKRSGRDKEIRERLKAADLASKRRALIAREEVLGGRETASARFRTVLRELGPLYSVFADYLSVRADMIPLADCIEFGKKPTKREFTPQRTVHGLLQSELSGANFNKLRDLEAPTWTNPMFQWHRATLDDGAVVTIKILRPEFEQQLEKERTAMGSLESARVGLGDGTELDMTTALSDFSEFVEHRIDLQLESAALADLAGAVHDFDSFVVPPAYSQLCTRRMATTASFKFERRLAAVSNEFKAQPGGADNDSQTGTEDKDLARRLAFSWLQQALLSSMYPIGPFEDDMVILPGGRFGVTGGLVGRHDAASRGALLKYLTAVAKDEPVRACDILLDLYVPQKSASSRETMRSQFRQAEPFRSGGWSDHYIGHRLADNLFVQWRLIWQGGYRPTPQTQAFTRSLFEIERRAREFAPDSDGLREGLNDLRLVAAIVRIREQIGPTQLEQNMYQFIETGSSIMQKLVEEPAAQDRIPKVKKAAKGDSNLWIAVSGLSLILVSLGLILERLTVSSESPLLTERAAAVIFIIATLGIIWYIRPRGENE